MLIIETRLEGVKEILAGLQRVEKTIETGLVDRVGRRLAREAQSLVRRLTPRQRNRRMNLPNMRSPTKRGFPALWKRWEVLELASSSSMYQAVIRNSARLDHEGMLVLASLEFGAKPHAILPQGNYPLRWWNNGNLRLFTFRASSTPVGGAGRDITDLFDRRRGSSGEVHARGVQHPGHKSFRMVAESKKHLQSFAGVLLATFAAQIKREFGAGFQLGVR